MAGKCDRCGRNRSSSANWKDGNESLCSGCVQLQLLQSHFTIFPRDGSDMMTELGRKIERLIDKHQEEETLPLVKQGLAALNGFIVREREFSMVTHGIYYYNEKMKETDRIDSSQFIVERTNIAPSSTFVVVIYIKKDKDPETWKFIIGHMAGL